MNPLPYKRSTTGYSRLAEEELDERAGRWKRNATGGWGPGKTLPPIAFVNPQRSSSSSDNSSKVDALFERAASEALGSNPLIHVVKETDTLPRLALCYNVPAALIKKTNQLSSDEIWFRRTLKIPLPQDSEFLSSRNTPLSDPPGLLTVAGDAFPHEEKSSEFVQSLELPGEHAQRFAEFQKISALKKLCPGLSGLANRQLLEASEWDTWKSLALGEWILRFSRESEIDWREALAYLQMNAFDPIQAELQLREDVAWEKRQGAPTTRQVTSSRRASCLGSTRQDSSDEELDRVFGPMNSAPAPRGGPRRRRRATVNDVERELSRATTEMSINMKKSH